jgi:predicted nucleotidyltransferase
VTAGQGRPLLAAVQTLTEPQRELVLTLNDRLSAIAGVVAVVLGGSHARGRARPDSDIDLGLLYREAAPFSIDDVRALAQNVNDRPDPVVSDFYAWGQWVNGGAWLSIGGQRVDFLYRNIDQQERVIAAASAGHYEHDYGQQPPFGYYSDTSLGDIQTCVPLFDPEQSVVRLKRAVSEYPPALRLKLAHDGLFSARFALYLARNSAAAGDAYLTAACATRAVNYLVQAAFAINRRYRVNDKTALAELADAEHAPRDFAARARAVFTKLGETSEALCDSVETLTRIATELVTVAGPALADDGAVPAWLASLDMSTI